MALQQQQQQHICVDGCARDVQHLFRIAAQRQQGRMQWVCRHTSQLCCWG